MVRIGMFSDDVGSSHAAAMVAQGLSQVGRKVTLVAPEFRPGSDLQANVAGPVSTRALPDRVNAFEVQAILARPHDRNRDRIVALPLAALRERAIRIQFDAVLAVGREHPAAERALAAARYDTAAAVGWDAPPAWFLACSGQDGLRTRANLSPERGHRLPFAVRSLPATLPRLSRTEATALLEGRPDADMVRDGILLAVLAVAVAADPHARRIDAGTLSHLMASRDLADERKTSDLLVRLANAYERNEVDEADRAIAAWASDRAAERRGATTRRRAAAVAGRTAAERRGIPPDAARRTP